MPLRDELFTLGAVPQLGSFDCGPSISGKAATEWIFCGNKDNSAEVSMAKGTQVWLYRDEHGTIVGFCSLGPTGRTAKGIDPPIAMIPQFGLDAKFQRFPANVGWEDRYSAQILVDILYKARELGYRGVFLLVHHTNTGAIKLYQRVGFVPQGQVKNDYLPMIVNLTPPS